MYAYDCRNLLCRLNIKLTYVILRVKVKKGVQKMPLTPKEMIKLLKKNGFKKVSQNGSHVKLKNEKTGRQVIVPYHSKEMKKGLEQAILKEAGLK